MTRYFTAAVSLMSVAGDCGLAGSLPRLASQVGSGRFPTALVDADAAGATRLLWTDPSVGQGQGPAERAWCSYWSAGAVFLAPRVFNTSEAEGAQHGCGSPALPACCALAG